MGSPNRYDQPTMVTAVRPETPAEAVREAERQLDRTGGEVRIPLPFPITCELLENLSLEYELLRFEASTEGELIISGATWGWIPDINSDLSVQLLTWAKLILGSSVAGADRGFLPPGWSARLPDVSWMSPETVAKALAAGPLPRGYWPVAPDFVIETKSKSDSLARQLEKTQGWADHGTALAVLVDPGEHAVYLCRPGRPAAVLIDPLEVSCEPEMPGLSLDFTRIWQLADLPA